MNASPTTLTLPNLSNSHAVAPVEFHKLRGPNPWGVVHQFIAHTAAYEQRAATFIAHSASNFQT